MFPNLKTIPIVNVFKDNDGIIKVKTKITERKDDPNFIAPILKPSKCLLTTRLIEYYHLKHCHAGVQILMSILREKFWIMKTRKTARKVVMKCVPYRRYSSNSPMSDPVSLPVDRVQDANAFDITGIDLAGPLFTRDGAVVNSRPLTYVSEDPNDLIPLTPSLFLNGKFSYDTIDLDLSEFSKFQKRIRYRRKLIHDFRSHFRKEYLGQLRQKCPGKPGYNFKVGDAVMIEEPSKKRVYWPLGKVISLLPGRDGKVRTLKLKCKNSELIRPIQRVYLLEMPVINNGAVKIDGVPTSSVNEDKLTSNAVIKNKVTRTGRLVKIPERLGLFKQILFAFE
ncbi:putative RNA-directed DNA polymerase from transposon X-element [Trichonephila clavipes]|nr:putative RNA-directed DNA polymerase from transposon X-element [Trichonephila clavipes]